MATIIPALSTISRMTRGERRLGRRLESLLEDDYLVWYDIPLGRSRRYPDFIILHPGRGLLFLEVKDWKIDTLRSMTPDSAVIDTQEGRKTVSNPLAQARQSAFAAIDQLKRDPQLTQTDERYRGKLCFPYGHGVVFPNITRRQWNQAIPEEEQERLLPAHRLICKDEMATTIDPEVFQQQLWDMFDYRFGEQLSVPQIERIRWHLFPEVRIDSPTQDLFADDDEAKNEPASDLVPDIVRVMDLQQEQLARSMGDGHRVIHGVAGSGKTLILGYRCLHLAQAIRKPILVLCFNITLAARLRRFIVEKGIEDKVRVHHFHEWCGLQLKTYQVNLLPGKQPTWERQVESVIQAVDRSQIPRAQYGALMIDEGHDFEQAWLKLVVQMIDPDTNSLLLLYDDAQSIYQKSSLKFPLSSAGVQARGRTTILKLNYRNTREILTFAYDFARDFLQAHEEDEDHVPLIAPEVAGVSGPEPAFRRFRNADEEARYVVRCVTTWQQQGCDLNGIAIVYTSNAHGRHFHTALQSAGIPSRCLQNTADKRAYDPQANQVVLLSRQSSKGLEFDTVILCGLGTLADDEEDRARETRLLYVGMTRARRRLLVTSSGNNWYATRLGEMTAA
ncbi:MULTISPECIES: nuclease-related domain-containing DEAD/DEAH box helicase [unclassified Modicisalibacter]|uniref:3'-5' exonuclease n=1 Tax=unclassified Modicisalibacter TaxID=2679913 RepID=UPI001CCB1C0D|nr:MULTISPECIES: nuclease-related domain-containing DEAD/DEAH box helicase [unclassified Modicisalibacter]MBZ9558033.1 NERD domain-containing protein [Modicisalibacter sp. R2A 31.J]MBZ9573299.1 NERD domain-containing protein [Modicisalibacter sp. MOD 31.J]